MGFKDGEVGRGIEVDAEKSYSDNFLKLLMELEQSAVKTFTESNFKNVIWDTFINNNKYNSASSTSVFLNQTGNHVILEYDNVNATHNLDFTGASIPAGWTEDSTGGGTITFDAANDEEDFSVTGGTQSCFLENDNNSTAGIYVAGLRNLSSANAIGDGYRRFGLYKNNDYLVVSINNGNSQWSVLDSEGNSLNFPSTPSLVFLRRTIRKDGSYKSEFSTSGDSGYKLLGMGDTGGDTTSAKIRVQAIISTTSGPGTISGSCYVFKVFTDYKSSGDYVHDIRTASDTVIGGMASMLVSSTSGGTATPYIAADGTNFEAHTAGEYHAFSNTGTTPKFKITIESDSTDTPQIDQVGYQWTEG